MNTEIPFVIISAYSGPYTRRENKLRSRFLMEDLRTFDLEHIKVTGKESNGTDEESFLVWLPKGDQGFSWTTILALARAYNQESVLFVDANRYAYLIDPANEDGIELGRWREASPDLPNFPLPAAYTKTPDGRIWTTEKTFK